MPAKQFGYAPLQPRSCWVWGAHGLVSEFDTPWSYEDQGLGQKSSQGRLLEKGTCRDRSVNVKVLGSCDAGEMESLALR